MRRFLTRIHHFVTRTETYLSLLVMGMGSSFFTYISTHWDALSAYNAAFIFACTFGLIALAISASSQAYLAISHFRERRGIEETPSDSDDVTSHPIVTAVANLEFEDRIYVGEITVSGGKLNELCLQISIRGYNATGETIRIDRVRGFLTAIKKVNGLQTRIGMQLPPPQITNHRHLDAGTPDQSEYFIILEQRIFPAVATDIQDLADRHSVQLECERLEIVAVSAAEPRRSAQLRLWDAISITRSPDRLFTGRVINARGALRAGAAQVEG